MRRFWITTADNPFNPLTNYEEWQAFDHEKGYYTTEYVARVAICAEDLGDEAFLMGVEEAIDSIVQLYPDGFYKKVEENDENEAGYKANTAEPGL